MESKILGMALVSSYSKLRGDLVVMHQRTGCTWHLISALTTKRFSRTWDPDTKGDDYSKGSNGQAGRRDDSNQ